MKLEAKHYAVLGAFLIAVGTQLAGLEHGWHDAATPAFVGGLLIQAGTTVAAVFIRSPSQKKETE